MTPEMAAWHLGGGIWQLPLEHVDRGPERRRGPAECPVCHEPAMIPATRSGSGKPRKCKASPHCPGLLSRGPIADAPRKPRRRKVREVATNERT